MDKYEIKQKVREAIEHNPFAKDILKVFLFGSHIHGTAREDSDIDLLIEFNDDARIGFFKFFDIQDDIERQVHKKIDLLTTEALSKYFREDVLKEAEIIYEKSA